MINLYFNPLWLLKKYSLFILVLLLVGIMLILWPASVVWAADPVYVRTDGDNANCDGTTNDPYPGSGSDLSCAFQTIQQGIDMVDPAGIINVAAGTYTETITVNRHVQIIGAGSGNNPASDTILRQIGNNTLITLAASGTSVADPILFKNLRVEPVKVYGFDIPNGSVDYIELDNVHVIGSNPTNTESEVGLRVATTASLSNLRIIDSAFDHLSYGWYFFKGDWTSGGSYVTQVYVANTSFSHNDAKGIYVEKLSDATFEDCIVHNNGLDTLFWNHKWNAGFDINLKGQETYQNLIFNNMVVTNNALGLPAGEDNGAGFMIKARDDAPSYNTYPAQLDNVQINNSIFTGNVRGIRFGEPGKNNAGPTQVTVSYSKIATNTYGLINETQTPITATHNWWNSPTGPTHTGNPGGTGDIISNTVTYSPWLCDGTDTSPDMGFQPIIPSPCGAIVYLPIIHKN